MFQKIFNLLVLLEDKINVFLLFLGKILGSFLQKFIPAFIPNTIKAIRQGLHHFKQKIRESAIALIKALVHLKQTSLHRFKSTSTKEKVEAIKKKAQDWAQLAQSKNLSGPFEIAWATVKARWDYLRLKYGQIPLSFKMALLSFTLLLTLSGTFLFQEIKKVYVGMHPHRNVAQEAEENPDGWKKLRPFYYKAESRVYTLENITFPVDLASKTNIKSLTMNFTVETSNRYLVLYFAKHEHEIRDHLNTSFHPIVAEFPLQDEGKKVLRDKIKEEINKFLVKKKIQGYITNVFIQSLIAG